MTSNAFDPMKGVCSTVGRVPPDTYEAEFVRAEYVPEKEADPMTGKGGKQFPGIRFVWRVIKAANTGSEQWKDREADTETTTKVGPKTRYMEVVGWLLGKKLLPGEAWDIGPCVGKRYLITVGSRPEKQWVEVVNAMPVPGK